MYLLLLLLPLLLLLLLPLLLLYSFFFIFMFFSSSSSSFSFFDFPSSWWIQLFNESVTGSEQRDPLRSLSRKELCCCCCCHPRGECVCMCVCVTKHLEHFILLNVCLLFFNKHFFKVQIITATTCSAQREQHTHTHTHTAVLHSLRHLEKWFCPLPLSSSSVLYLHHHAH